MAWGLHTLTGSGSPSGVVTPDYLGQHYVDTASNTIYQAYGTTSSEWSANLTEANVKKTVDDKSSNYTNPSQTSRRWSYCVVRLSVADPLTVSEPSGSMITALTDASALRT